MATTAHPQPTPVYRIVHVDCLPTILARGGLHSPNSTPNDGLPYRTIHDVSVQASRRVMPVRCGPGGTIHDYVPFYFGPLSVMLLKLKTGQVAGYTEGQQPIVYLISSAQGIANNGLGYVYTDGHGLAHFTQWFDNLNQLGAVDWPLVTARYWSDTPQDNDRKRRKQAEFLVHGFVPLTLITAIGVLNAAMKTKVEGILNAYPNQPKIPVSVMSNIYY